MTLAGRKFTILIIDETVELNAFAFHIILAGIAPADVWNQEALEGVDQKRNMGESSNAGPEEY